MTQRFYLHAATTTDTGTLPGAAVSISATTPTKIASGVNRDMNDTGGVLQTSVVLTTNANVNPQPSMIARWLSKPIAAQTINTVVNIGVSGAHAESNLLSNFESIFVLGVWRPGTGALVGRIFDQAGRLVEPGTAAVEEWEDGSVSAGFQTAVTSQLGDVLVLEWWRADTVQGMATGYTNTAFFDGTIEGSATTAAAFVDVGQEITMAAVPVPDVPYRNRILRQLLPT
jgi:hypothetical protein